MLILLEKAKDLLKVATPNQLPPHGQAAYVIPAIWPQTQTTTVPGPPVMASNVHQLFTMPVAAPIPVPAAAPIGISSMFPMHSPPLHLDSATVGFIPARYFFFRFCFLYSE